MQKISLVSAEIFAGFSRNFRWFQQKFSLYFSRSAAYFGRNAAYQRRSATYPTRKCHATSFVSFLMRSMIINIGKHRFQLWKTSFYPVENDVFSYL